MTTTDALLDWWFAAGADDDATQEQIRFWFGGGEDSDREIRERFLDDVEAALAAPARLGAPARDALAQLLLVDQLTRSLFRGTPRAFAGDAHALTITRDLVARGADRELRPVERVFAYLPLEHQEDMDAQREAVRCFAGLVDEHPGSRFIGLALDRAREHADAIERFGRFPWRNKIFDRETTQEELDWMNGVVVPA